MAIRNRKDHKILKEYIIMNNIKKV